MFYYTFSLIVAKDSMYCGMYFKNNLKVNRLKKTIIVIGHTYELARIMIYKSNVSTLRTILVNLVAILKKEIHSLFSTNSSHKQVQFN